MISPADKSETRGADSRCSEINLTQSELASWVGATREATVRCLRRLKSSGAIAHIEAASSYSIPRRCRGSRRHHKHKFDMPGISLELSSMPAQVWLPILVK